MTRDPESGVLQLKAGDETVNVTSQALQYNSFTQQDIDRGLYKNIHLSDSEKKV